MSCELKEAHLRIICILSGAINMKLKLIALAVATAAFGTQAATVFKDEQSQLNIGGKIGMRGQDAYTYAPGSANKTDGFEYTLLFRTILQADTKLNDDLKVFGYTEFDLNTENSATRDITFRYAKVGFEHAELGKIWYGKDWGAVYAGNTVDQFFMWGRESENGIDRINDNLNYEKKFGDFRINLSTTLEDVEIDPASLVFSGGGEAISLSYGADPYNFFQQGFGASFSAHNAKLGRSDAYGVDLKEDGDMTFAVGANYRTGGLYVGALVSTSDLVEEYKDELSDITWEVMSKYAFSNGVYVGAGIGQVYGTDVYSGYTDANKAHAILGYYSRNLHMYAEAMAIEDTDTQFAFGIEYMY